jgi:hypothetical protein
MKAASGNNRRKDFFIKKRFQATFIFYFLLVVITGAFLMGFLLYQRMSKALQFTMFMGHARAKTTWNIFQPLVVHTTIFSTLVTIGLTLLMTAVIIFYINRQCVLLCRLSRKVGNTSDPPVVPAAGQREFKKIASYLVDIHQQATARREESARRIRALQEATESAAAELSAGILDPTRLEPFMEAESALKARLLRPPGGAGA